MMMIIKKKLIKNDGFKMMGLGGYLVNSLRALDVLASNFEPLNSLCVQMNGRFQKFIP